MTNWTILVLLVISLGLLLSCSDSSTGTDPNPDENSEMEESAVTTGTLEASVTTSGEGLDENGYELTIDGDSKTTDPDDTVTFSDIEEGSYQLELNGLAENCTVEGDNPLDVSITAEETTSVEFLITCESEVEPIAGKIIYTQVQGMGGIYTMGPDGNNSTQISDRGSYANISPDGKKIVYSAEIDFGNQIHVMNADGTGKVQLTDGDRHHIQPSWSPDGTKIVFRGPEDDLFIINADGTGLTQITDTGNNGDPDWSPVDSEKIVFFSWRGDGTHLYTINLDGSDITQLTTGKDAVYRYPSWSPDGQKIAYAYESGDYGEYSELYVMDADGLNPLQLTDSENVAADKSFPAWSPNGQQLVFERSGQSFGDAEKHIQIINADGTGLTQLTSGGDHFIRPDWSPVE